VLRQLGVLALLVGLALLAGCFPASQYPQTAMEPLTEYGGKQQALWEQILLPAAIVFVVVEGGLLYVIWRFRARPGMTPNRALHGNTRLEVMWTIAPAVILAYIAVPTVTTIFEIGGPPPEDRINVEVIGHQWWWEMRYRDFTPPIVTANELHIPAGRYVSLEHKSADIIHSFWIPQLGGKRDNVPGHTNIVWFRAPDRPTTDPAGLYGQCAEFCGTSHANMRARAFVDSQADFDAWVRAQQAPAVAGGPGVQLFQTRGCVGCHQIVGVNAQQAQAYSDSRLIGPNLTHVGARTTIAGGMFPNDRDHMARWLKDPPAMKPGSRMPNLGLNDADAAALADYLLSLK
jgi:cytochrome c oxidase subunit 2